MKINLKEIDNKLLKEALSLNPDKTTKEVIEEAIRLLVRTKIEDMGIKSKVTN